MHEHNPRIRIHRSDCLQGKQMLRAFQDPLPLDTILLLQKLQEALMETVSRQMTLDIGVQPLSVRWNKIRRIKSQATKHMRRDFAAFLGRIRIQGMQRSK